MSDTEKLEKCIESLRAMLEAESPGDMYWIIKETLKELGEEVD